MSICSLVSLAVAGFTPREVCKRKLSVRLRQSPLLDYGGWGCNYSTNLLLLSATMSLGYGIDYVIMQSHSVFNIVATASKFKCPVKEMHTTRHPMGIWIS